MRCETQVRGWKKIDLKIQGTYIHKHTFFRWYSNLCWQKNNSVSTGWYDQILLSMMKRTCARLRNIDLILKRSLIKKNLWKLASSFRVRMYKHQIQVVFYYQLLITGHFNYSLTFFGVYVCSLTKWPLLNIVAYKKGVERTTVKLFHGDQH